MHSRVAAGTCSTYTVHLLYKLGTSLTVFLSHKLASHYFEKVSMNLRATRERKEKTLARKIASLEKRVRLNTGETKCKQFSAAGSSLLNNDILVIDLAQIPNGDSVNERTGYQLMVKKVRIRGHSSNHRVDWFLIRANGDDTPQYTDFHPTMGGGIDTHHLHQFKELRYFRPSIGTSGNVQTLVNFKYPLRMSYNTGLASSCIKNQLFLVLKNNTGGTVADFDYFVEVYYTDK
jgi:hypothetical protein